MTFGVDKEVFLLLQKLLANRHIFLNNSRHVVLLQEPSTFWCAASHSPSEYIALLDMPANLLEFLRAWLEGAWEYLSLGRYSVMEIIIVQLVVSRNMKTAIDTQGKAKETKLKS